MGEEIGHECGFALVRLLKPPQYYVEKYGTHFFGLNRMYMLMEKQRNRGQDGAGVASVTMDVPPGTKYIHCDKSIAADPIKDLFGRVQTGAGEKLGKAPPEACVGDKVDPQWVREHIPFCGETLLAHVRYGTDSENSIDRCHPVMRESNWMTRNLILAGNFNITNNEDLFSSLVKLGQHPRELSDTVMLLEKVGHFVDKENNDLYVKYSASGHDPQTSFSLIAENLNIARILRRAATDWDGGYCIAGMLGHGDAFVLRDPSGIRPASYYADEDIIVVASEAPLIQSVFNVREELVKDILPGQALCIKRSGAWTMEKILEPLAFKQCSFERVYFSRGNDAGVYREREELGRLLLKPLLMMLDGLGVQLQNTVLSFIPNTAELAFNGLAKEAQAVLDISKRAMLEEVMKSGAQSPEAVARLQEVLAATVRVEKVIHKDAKVRTFIQEDGSREHLTMHAYDVHYGTIRRGQDAVVALDDSIVRGNTLKNAILRTLDRMGPTHIIVISSCPQIRFPDVYGIDMAKLGDLAAFKAAVSLLRERGMSHVIDEVYRGCKTEMQRQLKGSTKIVNHVKRIYEPFTPEEISERIARDVLPHDCKAKVSILYQTVADLHKALPNHEGDWYFTGDYPTEGGARVACRAFALWMEGSSQRCYGLNSALSTARFQRPVLVLGSGAREHALACKIAASVEVSCVYVAPGNGGTSSADPLSPKDFGNAPLVGAALEVTGPDFAEVISFCQDEDIHLVVVGPEVMLADGIVDVLKAQGIATFGPSKAASQIESSKAFAKDFMARHKIPTSVYKTFKGKESLQAALAYVDEAPFQVVVKASGLAAGKGVIVPANRDEAKAAVRDFLEKGTMGQAGAEIVLEEKMEGPECSVLCLTDGTNMTVLPPAQDHKRAFDGDEGPNTGGMGAFAPTPTVDAAMLERIKREILVPTIEGMKSEKTEFRGCLFAGLMLTADGPKVIEFNCRFGDPETQAIMPLLECDFYSVLKSCVEGRLKEDAVRVLPKTSCVSIVMASGGYPGKYEVGHEISGLRHARCVPGVSIYHAGTKAEGMSEGSSKKNKESNHVVSLNRLVGRGRSQSICNSKIVSNGGRVLAVTAVGHGLAEARERAYVATRAISFKGAFFRTDIASPKDASDGMGRHGTRARATYLGAGVDVSMEHAIMVSIAPLLQRTNRAGCESLHEDGGAAGLAGLCNLAAIKGLKNPMLVSSTSSVGTKLKVAMAMDKFSTVGVDLVALLVNDVAARGAEPVFMMGHLAAPKLDAEQALNINQGLADGCVEAGCAMLGSKTAEMPGIFTASGIDISGFVVGVMEQSEPLPHLSKMKPGDVLIGLPSSGLHSNGFSLLRSLAEAGGIKYRGVSPFDPTRTFGEVLLTPSRIYSHAVLALAKAGQLKGAAPITSGGLLRGVPRALPKELQAQLRADKWELPAVFRWIAWKFEIPCHEMVATFNCGIGMVLVVGQEHKEEALQILKGLQEEPVIIGELKERSEGAEQVVVQGAESSWLTLPELGVSMPFPDVLSSLKDKQNFSRTRTCIVGGGESTPFRSVLEASEVMAYPAEIAEVVSLNDSSSLIGQAKSAGINHTVLSNAATRMVDLEALLKQSEVDLVIFLDDFDVRQLDGAFCGRWEGKLLVVRAALQNGPKVASEAVLDSITQSACITGCTVFQPQSQGAMSGPIVTQETTRVSLDDTVVTLSARIVNECQSKAVPEAIRLIASGKWVKRKLAADARATPAKETAASVPAATPNGAPMSGDAARYGARGVSADKGDVHAAIKNVDKGLFPSAFCKIVPDSLSGDPTYGVCMHADGAGTKSSLAYMYWRKTGDLSVWKGIAQDAIVMNLDDLLCVGCVDNILLSSTIGRNKNLIPREVIGALINGTEELVQELKSHGVGIILTGGETADVGDLVRTIIVDSTVTARIPLKEVIDNGNIAEGDVIVGLASSGQATYERCYNSGMGSNGLTSARHDVFSKALGTEFPESFDPSVPQELVYSGGMSLEDQVQAGNMDAGKLVLSPTRTYAPIVKKILQAGLHGKISGMIHCSGGAQTKILHFLGAGLHVVKDNLLPTPPVFRLIQEQSKSTWEEMYKVFNCGHRMEFYCKDMAAAQAIIDISKSFAVEAQVVGRVGKAPAGEKLLTIKSEHGVFEYAR